MLTDKLKKEAREVWRSINRADKDKIVIPLIFKRDQKEDLQEFNEVLNDFLKSMEDRDKVEDLYFFERIHKLNIFKWDINSVRDIALKVYLRDGSMRVDEDFMIYILSEISDLSPKNVYILEDGLPDCSFKIIIPTYNDFLNYNFNVANSIELIPHTLYNPKNLFCEFMLRCIQNDKVRAYLPPECISLIEDFDIYPISYREGCRRLTYCIAKYHLLLTEKQLIPKFQFVRMGSLCKKIQESIGRVFSSFREEKEKLVEMLVRCILIEDEEFSFDEIFTGRIEWFENSTLNENEESVTNKIRTKLLNFLHEEKDYERYSMILEEDTEESKMENQEVKTKRKSKKK